MKKLIWCLALLLVACGNATDEADDLASPTQTPEATAACEDRTPPAPAKDEDAGETKPEIEIPDGDPPCDLVIQDIKEGDGAEAEEGATVTVHYVGVSWSTGEEFDASWDGGEPIPLSLGQVIDGWKEGIPGMKEGGRRQLIIPPDLAYGDAPPPGSTIEPGETLVFVIDLVEVG
jgi:peptidylprolyl isomerase